MERATFGGEDQMKEEYSKALSGAFINNMREESLRSKGEDD